MYEENFIIILSLILQNNKDENVHRFSISALGRVGERERKREREKKRKREKEKERKRERERF